MDAISYYEKAGDYGSLIEQIYALPFALPDKIAAFLLEIMKRIPEKVYSKQGIAYIVLTRLLSSQGKIEEATAKLHEVINRYEKLSQSKAVCRLLSGCYNNLGFIDKLRCLHTRDYSFYRYFEKAYHYYTQWGGKLSGPMTVVSIGAYVCRTSVSDPQDMEKMIKALDIAVPYVAASMGGCMYGADYLARGEVALFKMDMDKAEGYLKEARARAQQKNQYEIESQSLFYLLRINIFRGKEKAVREILKSLSARLDTPEYLNRYIYYDIFRGWFYAHIGDSTKMAAWLTSDSDEGNLNSFMQGLEMLVRAKNYLQAKKNYSAALVALERSARSAGDFIMGKVEIKVLEAVCRYQMKDKKGAYASLEQAYTLARPCELYLPFVESGKDMRSLASSAIKDKVPLPHDFLERIRVQASSYAKKFFLLTQRFEVPAPHAGKSSALRYTPERLTRREHEILVSLFQGFTQEEIAHTSSRSINTIKSIVKRLYTKLGAANRADAIRIAISQGHLEFEPVEKNQVPSATLKRSLIPGIKVRP
jgi:LuxR family maltose regulon positive regulatory protein